MRQSEFGGNVAIHDSVENNGQSEGKVVSAVDPRVVHGLTGHHG